MSLQLHLPLLGDLRNNGLLGDAIATNHGATVNDSGKLGQCYAFNGSQYITVNNPLSANTPEFSIAAWVYFTDVTGYYASIYCARTATGGAGIVAYIYDSGPDVYLRFDDGATYQATYNLPRNQWVHLVFVRTRTGKAMYVNGVSVMGTTTVGNLANISTTAMIGNDQPSMAHGLKGRLNDIRVYDHRISDREIKELAKGLVAHWKLDDLPGNENLVLNGNAVEFNGVWVAGTLHRWGGWYNATDRSIEYINGKYWFHCKSPASTTYGGFYQDQNCTGHAINIKPNTNYTVSALWFSSATCSCRFWLHMRSSEGGGNLSQVMKSFDVTPVPTLVTYTFNSGTNANYTINLFNLMMGPCYTTEGIDVYFTDVKMEEGTSETPWIPSKLDAMYSDWEYDQIHDSSGYGHNGEITGTVQYSSDTARYSASSYFADNTVYVKSANFYPPSDAITISVWVKGSGVAGGGNYHQPVSIDGGPFELSIDGSGKFRNGFYVNGTRSVVTTNSINVTSGDAWHMLSATFDGSAIKRYVDGELIQTTPISGTLSGGTARHIWIGRFGTSTGYYNKQLYESDLRIYATALSADDIKELYNTSASIDNRHNVYAREFIET